MGIPGHCIIKVVAFGNDHNSYDIDCSWYTWEMEGGVDTKVMTVILVLSALMPGCIALDSFFKMHPIAWKAFLEL